MPTTFIPFGERQINHDVIESIANAVYGNAEDAEFLEQYVPLRGRVPVPKVNIFTNCLIRAPRCLWAVSHEEQVVGFITIGDYGEHVNVIGFGIKLEFARHGIMAQAWAEIRNHSSIQYPLYGSTSSENLPAINFLEMLNFEFVEQLNFLGEPSIRYVLNSAD